MSFVVTCDVTVKLWVYIFSVQNCDMEKLISLRIIFFLGLLRDFLLQPFNPNRAHYLTFPSFCWIISIVKKMHWISSVIALFRSAFALDWTVIVSLERGNILFGWWGGKNTKPSTFSSLIFLNIHLYKFPLYCSAFICRCRNCSHFPQNIL